MTAQQGMTPDEVRALDAVVPLLTAARAWGLGKDSAYDLAARGELPFRVLRLGRQWRVTRADLLASLGIPDHPDPTAEDTDRSQTPPAEHDHTRAGGGNAVG